MPCMFNFEHYFAASCVNKGFSTAVADIICLLRNIYFEKAFSINDHMTMLFLWS